MQHISPNLSCSYFTLSLLSAAFFSLSCSSSICSIFRCRQFWAATLFLPRLLMSRHTLSCSSDNSFLLNKSLNSSMGRPTSVWAREKGYSNIFNEFFLSKVWGMYRMYINCALSPALWRVSLPPEQVFRPCRVSDISISGRMRGPDIFWDFWDPLSPPKIPHGSLLLMDPLQGS